MNQKFKDLEVYFHIGIERTGTKFLQKSIFPTYKDIYFINKKNYKNAVKIISKRKYKRYLVSMELNLNLQFEQEIRQFSYNFPNAKIIMVLRQQHEWLESHYKRIIKNGEKKTFKQFLNLDTEQSVYKINDLYYMDKIRILEKHFSPVPLYLLFDELRANPLKYLNQIADYVDVSFDPKGVNLKHVHTSYEKNQLLAIRQIRKYINIDRKKPTINKIINLFHHISVDIIRYAVMGIAKYLPNSYFGASQLIPPQELTAIKDFYQKDWDHAVVYTKSKEM